MSDYFDYEDDEDSFPDFDDDYVDPDDVYSDFGDYCQDHPEDDRCWSDDEPIHTARRVLQFFVNLYQRNIPYKIQRILIRNRRGRF